MRMRACVGHSPQTRLFSPAENFARVRLRNFCLCKRPSFLTSRRFASGKPDTSSHDLFGQKHTKKRGTMPPFRSHMLYLFLFNLLSFSINSVSPAEFKSLFTDGYITFYCQLDRVATSCNGIRQGCAWELDF